MLPEVKSCRVNDCFYNRQSRCHAYAITVGSRQPFCETFTERTDHSARQGAGEVGACHIEDCEFNDQLYCRATDDIEVGWSEGKAICRTYKPQEKGAPPSGWGSKVW